MKVKLKNLIKSREFRIYLATFLLIILFTGAAFAIYGYILTGIDDANITFVYARNLANGHGFVYNIGGEHVEGSSTMLWTLILAVLFKIAAHPEILILLINIIVLTLSIGYLLNTLYSISFTKNKSLVKTLFYLGIILVWIFAIPTYIAWSTITLMEFGLYSSILITFLAILLKKFSTEESRLDKILFSILIVFLVLIRPESMLWGAVFLFIYFITDLFLGKGFRNSIKKIIPFTIIFFATLAALILFRVSYFGYPLPNTYYAKVSVDFLYNLKQGYYYFQRFINSNIIVFFLLSFTGGTFGIIFIKILYYLKLHKKISVLEFQLFIIDIIILIGVAIPVLNGGDQFPQFRFMQPIWPILILPFIYFLMLIDSNEKRTKFKEDLYLFTGILIVLLTVFYNANNINWDKYKEQDQETLSPQFRLAIEEQQNGRDFNRFFNHLEKLPTIGVVAAGAAKLTYNGDMNDLLGLNNVAMAHANPIKVGVKNHAAFDKQVFFAQEPEVMNLVLTKSFDISKDDLVKALVNYWNSILKSLYDEPQFQEEYTKAVVLNKSENMYLFGVYRNDFLESLNSNDYEVHKLQF